MAETQRRRSSRHKIEPLNYAEAALSPALKGMTSFLDVSPENVRNRDFHSFGPTPELTSPEEQLSPRGESCPGDESAPAAKIQKTSSLTSSGVTTITAKRLPAVEAPLSPEITRAHVGVLRDKVAAEVESSVEHVSIPGDEAYSGGISATRYEAHTYEFPSDLATARGRSRITAKRLPAVEAPPSSEIIQAHVIAPWDEMGAGIKSSAAAVSTPGDETYSGVISAAEYGAPTHGFPSDLTPGRGRSKIRRCVLAQDGHSLGEEAIYQVLWRTGRAENSDPNGSRTNRMGAADIGFKVNMAKKNVRQNISRLFEKLALEILEDFETMNSQARLYRVYSYKQILERRRAAGMEYVLRNKGVVFCSQDGTELVSSPAYVSSPGGKTSIRPAPPKKRRASAAPEAPKYPQTLAIPRIESNNEADLLVVSQALNRYWTVDESAAIQLLRDCRRVRPDARADEIAFFVREKLDLSRNSRSITNPTGLILATVPQSFVGSSFDEFRRRMERHAKLAAEEEQRRKQEEAEMKAWILKDRERYESIVNDPSKSEKERDNAEKRLREISAWNT